MRFPKFKRWFISIILLVMLAPSLIATAEILPPPAYQYKGQRHNAILRNSEYEILGEAQYWNTKTKFIIELQLFDEWMLTDAQVFAGLGLPPMQSNNVQPGAFPCKREFTDTPTSTMIQCDLVEEFEFTWGSIKTRNVAFHGDVSRLESDGVGLANDSFWAVPVDELGVIKEDIFFPFDNQTWGGYFISLWVHPARGHFIDSPIAGLTYDTSTQWGMTDDGGGFDYFPGERVDLWLGDVYLGNPLTDHKISPLDVFENGDTLELIGNPVINMARLLQSLDAEGTPHDGILISPEVISCLNTTVVEHPDLNYDDDFDGFVLDFFDDALIEALIDGTMARCNGIVEGVTLVKVSAEEAKENLDRSLNTNMFRKNVSKTPDMSSTKSKLNLMAMWFPAMKANNEPVVVEYFDENGVLINSTDQAKPIVVAYTDAIEETGAEDVFVAISRDDGNTFKRKNVARAADRSSFTLENGEEFYGMAKKPVQQVQGNNILVAWTSKFCKGGRPTYAIKLDVADDPSTPDIDESADNYPYDDPYYEEDIWGVSGPQRSVDYSEDFPEVGEVPYSCVWVARGTIVTQEMLDDTDSFWARNNYFVGEIVWFKPERVTSGRRDANQVFMGGADDAGFAIAWQEDPDGLRPGQAKGPGPGWGGATTNHKTDIWYSYITMDSFAVVDENFISHGDQDQQSHELDEDILGRPKALVPMSLPVRVTDNDTLNTDNLMVQLDGDGYPVEDENGDWIPIIKEEYPEDSNGDHDGSHDYGIVYRDTLCVDFYEKVNHQDEIKHVCITADGRLLDGNTGASRPNLFLQKYKKPDGTFGAYAIFAYDESKGMGSGSPDHTEGEGPYGDDYVAECGKNSYYHSFDFQKPEFVSEGTLINLPQKAYEINDTITGDDLGHVDNVTITENITYVVDESGDPILDWLGNPQINYENARRPRFIMQGKNNIGDSRTIMLILYKEGEEGSGHPSDIMLRRMVVPAGQTGNPYRPSNIVCTQWETIYVNKMINGVIEENVPKQVCVGGTQNMSTVNPILTTPPNGTPTNPEPYGDLKIIEWEQTPDILAWPSGVNRYEDARAHRGGLSGDFIVMGYSYTPNWAAYRNGNDKYDLYIRRSFDGGLTWTTDPEGEGITTHCDTFTDPTRDPEGVVDEDYGPHYKYEVCWDFEPGEFERARNLSQLKNNKESVIEPRIVKAPGPVTIDGAPTGFEEDCSNPNLFYVTYGTATNPGMLVGDVSEEEEEAYEGAAPKDLYYSFSYDRGETYVEVTWLVNPDSDGNFAGEYVTRWDYLAKGDAEQGEAQIRMTPDGSRFYAVWVEDGEDKDGNPASDVWFRRIMPPAFRVEGLVDTSCNVCFVPQPAPPQPTPEPTPEETPEPTPEETPEPTPEPTPEETPEPTPEAPKMEFNIYLPIFSNQP